MQPHHLETQGSGSGNDLKKNKGATDAMRFLRRPEVYEEKRKEKSRNELDERLGGNLRKG